MGQFWWNGCCFARDPQQDAYFFRLQIDFVFLRSVFCSFLVIFVLDDVVDFLARVGDGF